ncbi:MULTISPECIES: chorismate--pyruvate lyase family protein [Deefgea]|uniref:Probable chorismate pyruvate-lyase n=1 Tax=Deefgea chitinilytica TaxID=570276 RepID=A0ABS2CAZ3_9NEIS|nr:MULTISPECIES: chorismate lyase [Deefgea]MBM5571322.1 chorismate lyase [Deefgea chitinilytica]MBM9888554.1 chorismate lyase [Deefgea sp. CFH1-16]
MPHTAFWHSPSITAPRELRPWLSERGSLTQRLIAHFSHFHVRVLQQGWHPPHLDERTVLQLPRQQTRVASREVLLCSADRPLVFAHSITRRASLQRGFHLFGRSGSRPLGALLFADPTIRRSHLSWRKLNHRHPLWQKAVAAAGPQAATLWARRSVFYACGDQLLVTEVFLTDFLTSSGIDF